MAFCDRFGHLFCFCPYCAFSYNFGSNSILFWLLGLQTKQYAENTGLPKCAVSPSIVLKLLLSLSVID